MDQKRAVGSNEGLPANRVNSQTSGPTSSHAVNSFQVDRHDCGDPPPEALTLPNPRVKTVAAIKCLPPELLIKVFTQIDYDHETFVGLTLVNKRFRDVIQENNTQLREAIVEAQFWQQRLLSLGARSADGSALRTLRENKIRSDAIIDTIVSRTECNKEIIPLLRAGLYLVHATTSLPATPLPLDCGILQLSYRPSTDAAMRKFSTKVVEAALESVKARSKLYDERTYETMEEALQHPAAPLSVEFAMMDTNCGIDYVCWILGLKSVESVVERGAEDVAISEGRKFSRLKAWNELLGADLSTHDALVKSILNGQADNTQPHATEPHLHLSGFLGLPYAPPVGRSVRLAKVAIRKYDLEFGDIGEGTKETILEMYRSYESCQNTKKKDFNNQQGKDGDNNENERPDVFAIQAVWIRRCMDDPSLFKAIYGLDSEEQVLKIGAEDLEWYLEQRDDLYTGTGKGFPLMAKALRRSNDAAGISMPWQFEELAITASEHSGSG